MSEGSGTGKKKPPNPEGNPWFSTDKNPSKLSQELDEPCDAKLTLRIPKSWKNKLAQIPNSEIRKHLKLLIINEEE